MCAAPATNVQIDWEHCLLAVLHKHKKAGREPRSALDQTCVGMRLLRGYDGPKNPAGATPYFRRAAEAGNATAMTLFANALLKGHGLSPDVPRALQLLNQAAALGQTDAMLTLGEFAFRGSHGQPQDRRAARARVSEAAQRGNQAAWTALQQVFGPEAPALDKAIVLYQTGQAKQAWPLFQQAARAGNVRAQFQIGWQLDKGEGVPPDAAAAASWYRKAADQGDGEAAAALGKLMEDSKGQAENWMEAASGTAAVPRLVTRWGPFSTAAPTNAALVFHKIATTPSNGSGAPKPEATPRAAAGGAGCMALATTSGFAARRSTTPWACSASNPWVGVFATPPSAWLGWAKPTPTLSGPVPGSIGTGASATTPFAVVVKAASAPGPSHPDPEHLGRCRRTVL